MGKRVTFYLGPVGAATARQLTITRMTRAGDDAAIAATHDADAGANETVNVNLPDNTIFQATLVDTLASGEDSDTDVLNFQTGTLQFPGPRSHDRLQILSMQDLSSSSSSPSSSSWSSHSSSSESSSSSQSSSSSSSSISTSSSSISTSSSSSSSISTSSSSSSESSSSSSSESSSSSSSQSSSSSSSSSSASSASSSSWSSQS